MKTRMGFVSNSSSSSFVLVGYDIPRGSQTLRQLMERHYPMDKLESMAKIYDKPWADLDDDEVQDLYYVKDHEIKIMTHEEQGAPSGRTVVGIEIASISSEGYGEFDTQTSFADIIKKASELGIRAEELKLYTGTYLS